MSSSLIVQVVALSANLVNRLIFNESTIVSIKDWGVLGAMSKNIKND